MQVGRHGVHKIMITLTREEAQQVLETLTFLDPRSLAASELQDDAIETLRARLAQTEAAEIEKTMLDVWQDVGDPRFPHIKAQPEPDIVQDAIVYGIGITEDGKRIDPASIYKEREWQSLTSTERKVLWKSANNPKEYADLLEAKLKEKNT